MLFLVDVSQCKSLYSSFLISVSLLFLNAIQFLQKGAQKNLCNKGLDVR